MFLVRAAFNIFEPMWKIAYDLNKCLYRTEISYHIFHAHTNTHTNTAAKQRKRAAKRETDGSESARNRDKQKNIDPIGNYMAIVALIRSFENKLRKFVFKSYSTRIDEPTLSVFPATFILTHELLKRERCSIVEMIKTKSIFHSIQNDFYSHFFFFFGNHNNFNHIQS